MKKEYYAIVDAKDEAIDEYVDEVMGDIFIYPSGLDNTVVFELNEQGLEEARDRIQVWEKHGKFEGEKGRTVELPLKVVKIVSERKIIENVEV